MTAGALDARVLAAIGAYALDDDAFLALARDLFAYQVECNAPYGAFARAAGFGAARLPARVEDIPAVPAAAFKEARLATFPPDETAAWFETSGTTRGAGGRHELPTTRLYDAALLASFDRMLLGDGARLRYLNLVPDPRERPHSSLGHMMGVVARERGDGADGWYLHGDDLDTDTFVRDAARACADGIAVCIATTAFALVALLDALAERDAVLALPAGSRIMETGGFKGRSARRRPRGAVRAGVGAARRTRRSDRRRVRDDRAVVAVLRHVRVARADRAARQGAAAVAAADRRRRRRPPAAAGRRRRDPPRRPREPRLGDRDRHRRPRRAGRPGTGSTAGLVLLGREEGAELRGCSLDAETLLARRG